MDCLVARQLPVLVLMLRRLEEPMQAPHTPLPAPTAHPRRQAQSWNQMCLTVWQMMLRMAPVADHCVCSQMLHSLQTPHQESIRMRMPWLTLRRH